MSNGLGIEVFGVGELRDLFDQLTSAQQRSVYLSAFRKGAKHTIKKARENILSRSEATRKSKVYKSLGTSPVNREVALRLGARISKRYKGQFAHLLEGGTKERGYVTRKGVLRRLGRIKPTNFWEDAITSTKGQVFEEQKKEIIESFKRYIERQEARKKNKGV